MYVYKYNYMCTNKNVNIWYTLYTIYRNYKMLQVGTRNRYMHLLQIIIIKLIFILIILYQCQTLEIVKVRNINKAQNFKLKKFHHNFFIFQIIKGKAMEYM